MRYLVAAFAAALLVMGVAPAAFATDRYASPSGSGTTCSSGSPCTLSTAVSQSASSGDRVLLKTGSYGTWTGTSKTSLTITPDSGVSPTIDLDLGSGDGGFTIDGGHDATWSSTGLTINGGTIAGTASNITIKNSKFAADFTIDGPLNANILLDHNKHDYSGGSYAIHFPYGNGGTDESGVTIQNSLFNNLSADGITIGAVGVDVVNNEFNDVYPHGNPSLHTDAIQLDSGANSTLDGNWIHGNCEQGIGGFDGIYNLVVTNNVVIGCTAHSITVGGSFTPSSDPMSYVRHNTVDNASQAYINCVPKATNSWGQTMYTTKVTIENNIAEDGLTTSSDGRSCSPVQNNNMFDSGASGTNFNGTPTYVGSGSYASYALDCGSAGEGAATDSSNVGAITGGEPNCDPSPFLSDTFSNPILSGFVVDTFS